MIGPSYVVSCTQMRRKSNVVPAGVVCSRLADAAEVTESLSMLCGNAEACYQRWSSRSSGQSVRQHRKYD